MGIHNALSHMSKIRVHYDKPYLCLACNEVLDALRGATSFVRAGSPKEPFEERRRACPLASANNKIALNGGMVYAQEQVA